MIDQEVCKHNKNVKLRSDKSRSAQALRQVKLISDKSASAEALQKPKVNK